MKMNLINWSFIIFLPTLMACTPSNETVANKEVLEAGSEEVLVTTMSPDVRLIAITSCKSALEEHLNTEVRVVGTAPSGSASEVFMRAYPSASLWKCEVSRNGSNPDIFPLDHAS